MLKNFSLRTKLLGGFLIVAVITLVVGGLAFYQLSSLAAKSAKISTSDLPGVQESLTIKSEMYFVGQSLRTLMSAEVPKEVRLRQFENIKKSRERSSKAFESYSKLEVDDKAKALFEDLKAKFIATREANNKALEMADQVIQSDLLRPDALTAGLQQFRGDHYRLMDQVSALILFGKSFEGGDDHTACNFGKWSSGFKTENKVVAEALSTVAASHQRFHQSISDIKKHMAGGAGGASKAKAVFSEVTRPSAELTFEQFRKALEEADKGQRLFSEMSGVLLGESRTRMNAALEAANALSDYHEATAEAASKELTISSAISFPISGCCRRRMGS